MRAGPHTLIGRDPTEVEGVRFERRIVRRVWAFARPYKAKIIGFLATIVAIALLDLVPVFLFKEIIDEAIRRSDRTLATSLALAAVGVAAVSAALGLLQRWWSSSIGEGLIFDLRVALYDHVQRMPVAFFTHSQTGSLISRMNNDVVGAQRAVTLTLGQVVSNLVVLVSTLSAMVFLEWRLTLLGFLVLPVFLVPTKRVGRKLQDLTREGMERNARMSATMTERFGVGGAMLVKLFGRHPEEVQRFSHDADRVREIGVRSAVYGRTFFLVLGLVGAVGTALVYWVGSLMVISGDLELGTLVAMAALVTRIYQPLTALTNARVDLLTALVSFERVFEVLDTPRAIDDRPGAVDLVSPRGRIAFDGVRFRYPTAEESSVESLGLMPTPNGEKAEGAWVLDGISVEMASGTMTALVGPSGAGKSTMSALIPRLYDVTEGAVRIDGHDVRDLTQQSLRQAIGVVSQDPHLFHDSIGANLRYARPDATDDDLEQACRAARIHHLIASLPDGYDTVVGERGYRLSGGEKQRVAIARLLLKDPAVVILDEATSHLDSENEALIQQALHQALAGRTSVVIAHRLSTVRAADQILVLDEGRVVEQGTHHELVAAGGLYADLHAILAAEDPVTADSASEDPQPAA